MVVFKISDKTSENLLKTAAKGANYSFKLNSETILRLFITGLNLLPQKRQISS